MAPGANKESSRAPIPSIFFKISLRPPSFAKDLVLTMSGEIVSVSSPVPESCHSPVIPLHSNLRWPRVMSSLSISDSETRTRVSLVSRSCVVKMSTVSSLSPFASHQVLKSNDAIEKKN